MTLTQGDLHISQKIALRLLALTAQVLTDRGHKNDLSWRRSLRNLVQVVEECFFDGVKGRRHHRGIECVWATIQTCISAMLLRIHHRCRHARHVGCMLAQWERDIFWDPGCLEAVGLLKYAVLNYFRTRWKTLTELAPNQTVVFAWSGCGMLYVGFAGQSRASIGKPGVPLRWLEHAVLNRCPEQP